MSSHGGSSGGAAPATTVTGPDAFGYAAVVGTGLHYARNDHDHGLPVVNYTALQYNDLLGWTFDGEIANTVLAPTAAGYLSLGRIPLPAPMTVTNLLVVAGNVPGVTLTHSFLALFKSDGTVIGQTVDQSTAWSTGYTAYNLYTLPLAGGPYVCSPLTTNDFLWAAIYCGTAVTLPRFYGAPNGVNPAFSVTSSARARMGFIGQANTATLGNIIPVNITPDTPALWFGIS